ncbi:sensor domain-containing diguanylate cyclase [Pseudooceanicola sp. CBS1P-1]|uniref:diguanylate cyclase n=1 Tax=Pseudooceanicola albus TaxID=2692189 RepID=A0A6L7G8W3_9RHOB|nr:MULTISPECIES: sensor domain-containing diguanylate cyclase [Pseudooceanicola]MBT9385775.1 sensor domain-containing diguanylate cyclase [Pseudooceanicola endophyticus]MXN20007.1 diguanylate cyclase [Pseudooceanicola albus]
MFDSEDDVPAPTGNGAPPRDAPFEQIVELARLVLDVPFAEIRLNERSRDWLRATSGITLPGGISGDRFCTLTLAGSDPLVVRDSKLDPRFRGPPAHVGPPGGRAGLGVPLHRADGRPLGVICAYDIHPRSFSGQEVEIMQNLAAIVLKELELLELADSDGLTGAMSRRAWMAAATRQLAVARQKGSPLALVMLDIDHFKQVNDTHGHGTGDLVLRELVRRCRARLRPGDLFGRIGGEEFAVLLPGRDAEAARRCAERLRGGIAETAFEDPARGLRLSVTASLGVCLVPDHAALAEGLAAADEALYRAKRDGRNQCCLSRAEAPPLPRGAAVSLGEERHLPGS